jgi:hypothetical protein
LDWCGAYPISALRLGGNANKFDGDQLTCEG